MKAFKINFKLQHLSSATKPIQVILSLATRHKGKYLTVEKSTGISIPHNEWDLSRRLPKNPTLATRFIRLEEDIKEWLDEVNWEHDQGDYTEEEESALIVSFYEQKYFHRMLGDKIDRFIEGKVTKINSLVKDIKDLYKRPSRDIYDDVMRRLMKLEYSIVDKNGKVVDTEKFFSNIPYTPEELTDTCKADSGHTKRLSTRDHQPG